MPRSTVDRREQQSAEAHLLAAAEYLVIAESGDAKTAAYEHAADELRAAQQSDAALTFTEIAAHIGRDRTYVRDLIAWREAGSDPAGPFGGKKQNERKYRHGARKTAAEQPEAFAEAYEQAPPEAKRRIAERIAESPELRVEVRKRDVEQAERRRPSPVKPRTDRGLYEFESRLVSARRDLREALALVDGIDATGDDEDILDLIRDCEGLLSAAAEAYRSGKSIETWAWELYERSAD